MNLVRKTEQIDFKSLLGDELIEYISFKEEFAEEAEKAFIVFCDRYQRDVLQKAEIYCNKFGYSEVVALEVATCAFVRVWRYHSFNVKKAKAKTIDKAILLWLYPIVYNEIIRYGERNTCIEPDEADLPVINDINSLIEFSMVEDISKKKDLKVHLEILERAMMGLSEKQKIIYLTYKACEISGLKTIPRKLSKKLKEQLELTQNSIRVYKMQAIEKVNNYLKYLE